MSKTNKTGDLFVSFLNEVFAHPCFNANKLQEKLFISKEVFQKYMRTLKLLGFNFKKISGKEYQLSSIAYIKPLKEDFNFLQLLSDFAFECGVNKDRKLFELVKNKLKIFLNSNVSIFKNSFKADYYVDLIMDNQQIEVEYYINKYSLKSEKFFPMNIISKGNEVLLFLHSISDNENKLLNVDLIKNIRQFPQKSSYNCGSAKKAVIKFKGKLKARYTLKERETIISKTDDFIMVSTHFADKKLFFRRVFRYGINCEIVEPSTLKRDYIKFLKEVQTLYKK